MRINRIRIKGYKNLVEFEAHFSNEKTVIIGQNASGKSNLLEAIIIIFRDLGSGTAPEFDFYIHYSIYDKDIVVRGNVRDQHKVRYAIWILDGSDLFSDFITQADSLFNSDSNRGNLAFSAFKENKDLYLPKHVFIYYSGLGNSNRIEDILHKEDKDFALSLVNNESNKDPNDRRFFYVRLHHSQFVLLSFYALSLDSDIASFLKDNLKIEDLETIMFVLKRPNWKGKKDGDPKFWGSKGVVRSFLNDLFDISSAPLRDVRPQRIDIWREQSEERLFLYISDIEKIKKLVQDNGWDNIQFFNVLESINASDLHRDIRIRIRKNYAGNITFKDLSEGEQQLLTVLGLMRFTRYEESLYLLDEPDTHLNPFWRWKYMEFISEIALKPNNSQVIMTSHDPFTIGSLTRDEVRIFKSDTSGGVVSLVPEKDPRGMGIAGIITEIFGLPTTLDIPTERAIEERRELQSRAFHGEELSAEDQERLRDLNFQLEKLGYSLVFRDPLYQKFEMEYAKRKRALGLGVPETKEDVEMLNNLAEELLKSMSDDDFVAK